MLMFDASHPFYRPLWRRVGLVGLAVVWALFEAFWVQDGVWAGIAGGIAIWFAWELLLNWKEPVS